MDVKKFDKNEKDVKTESVETSVHNLEQSVSKPKKATIANCYTVNIRKGKSSNAPRIRTVRAGTECKILKVINEWGQVVFPDQPDVIGYIPYKFLKED